MSALAIVLRLFHILLGVYWTGTLIFFATFLEPVVRSLGPDGGKVMIGLRQRRYFEAMPVVAVLTILSGAWLYWRDSAGLNGAWIASGLGMGLTIGAIAAIAAFAVGMLVLRPITGRVFELGAALGGGQLQAGPERDAAQGEFDRRRRRVTASIRWVATLLVLAVGAMAVARYL